MRWMFSSLGRICVAQITAAVSYLIAAPQISAAQTPLASWQWSESVYWQYAQEPLPNTAVGFALTRRTLGGRWWDLHLELDALAIMGHERKLDVCTANGCDDRQLGLTGSAAAQFIVGTPRRLLYGLVGAGGYASMWGTGSASGVGPRGGLADAGFGVRVARVKFEARFSGFGNTNYGNAQAISFRLGILQ